MREIVLSEDKDDVAAGALIEKEEIERGSVSFRVYLYYAKNVGWLLIFLVVLMAVVDAALTIWTNFWLSDWSEAGLGNKVSLNYEMIHIN